jgi:hypothetical protein
MNNRSFYKQKPQIPIVIDVINVIAWGTKNAGVRN